MSDSWNAPGDDSLALDASGSEFVEKLRRQSALLDPAARKEQPAEPAPATDAPKRRSTPKGSDDDLAGRLFDEYQQRKQGESEQSISFAFGTPREADDSLHSLFRQRDLI